ncbi:MAG: hypothetical protein ACOH18_00755 [Candidatus Saccharimonadaceae bacterium]
MSDEREINVCFNTAITGLSKETGRWDEKVHNSAVLPLRGLIMQIDGVSGCHISRYAMKINYLSNIVSEKAVLRAARAAVHEADFFPEDDLFPLRGTKTPKIQRSKPAQQPINTWWVARVDFNTDLFVNNNETQTAEITDELVGWLADADGARSPMADQRYLLVKFDHRQISPESLEAHLKKVVGRIMEEREGKKFFPFMTPTFTYSVFATPYVI